MKIRYQADNDLDEDILRAVKRLQPLIDFQRLPELGLHTGIPDIEVLQLCAQDHRILVTHDRHTMPAHFNAFIHQQDSPGIIIISRKLSIGKAAELLLLYGEASEAEEHRNQVIDFP